MMFQIRTVNLGQHSPSNGVLALFYLAGFH